MSLKNKILFGGDAREKMLTGVRTMAEAVTTTLGPRGNNVGIAAGDRYGNIYSRTVIHDGVTVAKFVELEDEFENFGAQLLKQAAQKQVQDCGDGTTVAVLLGRAIIEQVNILVSNGVNPMELRSSLEKYVDSITKIIDKLSTKITEYSQKEFVAVVSAEDEELGKLVAKTVDEMGEDGLIAVEESKGAKTIVERQDGMQIDKGWYNEFFITNIDRHEAILEKPYILITDKDIPSLIPLKDLIEGMAANGQRLFIVTPSINVDALGALVQNKMKGVLSSLVVSAPSYGQDQKNRLLDLAVFTGARFISLDAGDKLENIKLEDLGRAEYVAATKTDTIIVKGKGDKKILEKHIEGIRKALDKEVSEFDQEKLKERIAKLTTGVAIIKVGGLTEVEMLERIERVKDAVAATRAAVLSGIVAGGETIYLRVREKLPKPKTETDRLVHDLLYKALYEPFKKLVNNAGMNDGEIYEKLRNSETGSGVDVKDEKIKDMIKAGIVDPAMVPMQAIRNATSVAIQIMTTGAIIVPNLDAEERLSKLSNQNRNV